MNQSNNGEESATQSLSQSSVNIQEEQANSFEERTNSFEDSPYCLCWQHHCLKIVEKLFIVCGTFALSFFLFGILSLQNGSRHGDSFFLVGALFVIVLGLFMANQRNRIERLRALQGHGHPEYRNEVDPTNETYPGNVYVVPISRPTDLTSSHQPLIYPPSFGSGCSDKPEDEPPKYEDVVSDPPPSYESLNPNTLRS